MKEHGNEDRTLIFGAWRQLCFSPRTLSVVLSCVTLSLGPVSAGGAGGKGVWGRSGEVYEPEQVDKKDPNYDDAQVEPSYVEKQGCFLWGIWTRWKHQLNICNWSDALTGRLRVWDLGSPAGREGLWKDGHANCARILWACRHKRSGGKLVEHKLMF